MMNCETAKRRMIDLAYGELSPDEARQVEAHVAECGACRADWEDLAASCELIDRASERDSPGRPQVDVLKLLAEARRRDAARARRWRTAAWSAVAAAVVVAAAGIAQIRVEWGSAGLVIGWGSPAEAGGAPVADPAVPRLEAQLAESQAALAAHRRRLDDLDQLAALIVERVQANDARASHALAALGGRIEEVRRQNDQRWNAVSRGFHDWYLAQRLDPEPSAQETTVTPLEQGDSR